MNQEALAEIIRLHELWRGGDNAGVRADLSGAYLSWANLKGANLSGADLSGADLTDADLSGADLTDAYLINAKLSGANLKGANLFGADLTGANLNGADLTGANIPTVKTLHTATLAALESGGTLDMREWHTCDTTHCRAGWAVHLAGKKGRLLEKRIGTNAAAALIITKSCPYLDGIVPDFYATNDNALADIKRCAQIEKQPQTRAEKEKS